MAAGRTAKAPKNVTPEIIEPSSDVDDDASSDELDGPDQQETRSLVAVAPQVPVQGHLAVGVGALMAMSDEAFEKNLEQLAKAVERADRMKTAIMKADVDYGLIPGTNTPTLLKPGAEKLALAYGLVGRFVHRIHYGDTENVTSPAISVIVDSFIHLGSTDGVVVAQGMGACNTQETRYRYRGQAGRHCPNCGVDNVIPSRYGGWWCGERDGGCGAKFPAGDAAIESQEPPGKKENADPLDLLNTILKMAEKRSFVDGILRATASSGLFTQDMDDDEGDGFPGSGRDARSVGMAASAPETARSAPQRPAAAPTGGTSAPAAPGPSEGGMVQIVVSEKPETGVRMVKDAHAEKRWEGTRPKLEIIGKVGNRKHTGIVLGPLAEAAVDAGIDVGMPVQFVGAVVEEIVWAPDDPSKPTKKEVWGLPSAGYLMTDVRVGDGQGNWRSLAATIPTLGLDQAAAAPTSSTPPATESSGSASSEPEPPPAAAPSPSPAPTSDASATSSDRTGQRYAGTILVTGYEWTSRGNDPLVLIFGADVATGETIKAGLLGAGEIKEQLGSQDDLFVTVQSRAVLTGTWKPRGWIEVDTIGRASA